jgi:hypothetical protein
VDLRYADLSYADLREVKGTTEQGIRSEAKTDANTRF